MATRITSALDEELKLEIELPDGRVIVEDAASLFILYSEVGMNRPLAERYSMYRTALAARWSFPSLSAATTYIVVEKIVELTTALKKNHATEIDSPSSE